MEKAEKIAMGPARFGWSDVGSWDAVAQARDPDASGNSSAGRAQPCQGWGRAFESRHSLNSWSIRKMNQQFAYGPPLNYIVVL